MSVIWNLPGSQSHWDPGASGPECQGCGSEEIDAQSVADLEEQERDCEPLPVDLLCAECRAGVQD